MVTFVYLFLFILEFANERIHQETFGLNTGDIVQFKKNRAAYPLIPISK